MEGLKIQAFGNVFVFALHAANVHTKPVPVSLVAGTAPRFPVTTTPPDGGGVLTSSALIVPADFRVLSR